MARQPNGHVPTPLRFPSTQGNASHSCAWLSLPLATFLLKLAAIILATCPASPSAQVAVPFIKPRSATLKVWKEHFAALGTSPHFGLRAAHAQRY